MNSIPKPLRHALLLIRGFALCHALILLYFFLSALLSGHILFWHYFVSYLVYNLVLAVPYYTTLLLYLARGSKVTRCVFVWTSVGVAAGLFSRLDEHSVSLTGILRRPDSLSYILALLQLYASFLTYRPSSDIFFNRQQ